jgi:hypothetical protein
MNKIIFLFFLNKIINKIRYFIIYLQPTPNRPSGGEKNEKRKKRERNKTKIKFQPEKREAMHAFVVFAALLSESIFGAPCH